MTQDQLHPAASRIVIDARGLNCPLPVLRLRKRLQSVAGGVEVELLATDPAASRDVPAFCEAQGHTVRAIQDKGVYRFYVCKKFYSTD